MRTSESIKALAPALTAALGKLEGAAKNAKNPHFKNTYADLASVVDASRSVLAESDLAVMQSPGLVIEGRLQLFTRIIHKSGEWIEGEFHMPLAKSDPQATLATLTYARRGALMAILGIPAVDDDGETAVGRGTDTAASGPREQPRQAKREEPQESAAVRAAGVAIDLCNSEATLTKWSASNADMIAKLDAADKAEVRRLYGVRLEKLRKASNEAEVADADPFQDAA
jgi:hypothetical protein